MTTHRLGRRRCLVSTPLESGGRQTPAPNRPRLPRHLPRHPQTDTQGGTTSEVGPLARPLAACLHGQTMRVYLQAMPWVWLTTAAAGLLTWQALGGPDSASSAPVCVRAGQAACSPAQTAHVSRVLSQEVAE